MTDLDINFEAHPITGDLIILDEITSIKQSVKNLIKTSFYERKFWPNLGCQIANSLLEIYSQSLTEYTITKSIQNVIKYQEPRARNVLIEVIFNEGNLSIDAKITFTPVNSINSVTIRTPLQRIR